MRGHHALLTVIIASQFACDADAVTGLPPADALKSVPLSVVIDGKEMVLSASLSRDFMPVAPPDGNAMVGEAILGNADGSDVPLTLAVDSVFVVHENEVWADEPAFVYVNLQDTARYHAAIIGGPKWGPGIFVDVVARVIDSRGGVHRVRATNQPIGRTD